MSKKEKDNEIVIKTIGKATKQSIKDLYEGKTSDLRNIEGRIAMNMQDYSNYLNRKTKVKKKAA